MKLIETIPLLLNALKDFAEYLNFQKLFENSDRGFEGTTGCGLFLHEIDWRSWVKNEKPLLFSSLINFVGKKATITVPNLFSKLDIDFLVNQFRDTRDKLETSHNQLCLQNRECNLLTFYESFLIIQLCMHACMQFKKSLYYKNVHWFQINFWISLRLTGKVSKSFRNAKVKKYSVS